MALTTFALVTTADDDDWALAVDGATTKRFGIRNIGRREVAIAVATAKPNAASNDWFQLNGGIEGFSEELEADDKVYIRSLDNSQVTIRGYKVSR